MALIQAADLDAVLPENIAGASIWADDALGATVRISPEQLATHFGTGDAVRTGNYEVTGNVDIGGALAVTGAITGASSTVTGVTSALNVVATGAQSIGGAIDAATTQQRYRKTFTGLADATATTILAAVVDNAVRTLAVRLTVVVQRDSGGGAGTTSRSFILDRRAGTALVIAAATATDTALLSMTSLTLTTVDPAGGSSTVDNTVSFQVTPTANAGSPTWSGMVMVEITRYTAGGVFT